MERSDDAAQGLQNFRAPPPYWYFVAAMRGERESLEWWAKHFGVSPQRLIADTNNQLVMERLRDAEVKLRKADARCLERVMLSIFFTCLLTLLLVIASRS